MEESPESLRLVVTAGGLIAGFYALYKIRARRRPFSSVPCRHKAIFITGCDSGLGFSLASFCRTDLDMLVIAACHMAHGDSGARALKSLGCYVLKNFDITQQDKIDWVNQKDSI